MEKNNKTDELGLIAISKNVHPNTDRSPWGWIVLASSPSIRIATWSGYNELKMCQHFREIKEALNPQSNG